jgi:uncharacterized protein (DUF302 family)
VADTIEQLTTAIEGAGARLFVVVDHSGEAERAGLLLRDTKLLIFGSPAAGTPVMQVAPLAALDLPLKVLVWADDGAVWMSYLSSDWLAKRHDLPGELSTRLKAAEVLTGRVEASS